MFFPLVSEYTSIYQVLVCRFGSSAIPTDEIRDNFILGTTRHVIYVLHIQATRPVKCQREN